MPSPRICNSIAHQLLASGPLRFLLLLLALFAFAVPMAHALPPQKATDAPIAVFVRPGGTSYSFNIVNGAGAGGAMSAIQDIGFQNITAFNWFLTRGGLQSSTDGGANWTPYAVLTDNITTYLTVSGRIWRFVDTSPGDSTSTNSFSNCWHLVSAPGSTTCSGGTIIPDNAPTNISSSKATLFDNTGVGATIATLTPTDTGDTLRGFWTLESQSVPNLFALSFNRTTGNTATLTRGSAAVPAIGQAPTVTVRYHDVYQTDASGNPIAGQGFSKTLTYTVVAESSNALTLGNDVAVNTFTTGNQSGQSVALLSTGNVAVVWQSAAQGGGDGSGVSGIYGQLLSSAGAKVGGEFVISNVSSNIDELTPVVAPLASGRYVVAYATNAGGGYDIRFRLVEANGTVGGEFSANSTTAGAQTYPAIVTTLDGNFVLAWNSDNGDIRARKFNTAGAAVTGEVLFADGNVAGGYYPFVAALSNGDYALAWADYAASHIFVRMAPGGTPGTVIDTGIITGGYTPPRVVGLSNGSFVVASESYNAGSTRYQIEAIRYSNAGAVQTAKFQVNTVSSGNRYAASVAALTGGGFIVGWGADTGDFDLSGIFGRRYSATAVAVDASEFQVNQHRLDDQNYPALAPLAGDLFLASWTDVTGASIAANTYLGDIEARVLGPASTPDLTVTKVANGVFQQGGSASFTVTVTNSGSGATAGSYTLTDSMPTGLTLSSVTTPAGWDCTASTLTVVSCTRSTALAAAASSTITISVNIAATTPASITNTANVAGGGEVVTSNNSGSATVGVTAQADLSITKTDGVTTAVPGGSVTYTITASNAGPSAVTGATVADTFPAVLTCTWTCVGAGGGTCPASGSGNISGNTVNLPSGASVTYTASCTISAAATGTLSNTATVNSAVTDPNAANNSATDSDTLTPQANLSITKTDGSTSAVIGGSTTYTIVASNSGPSNAPGSSVNDTFPAFCVSPSWSCVGAGGGTCTASGSGNIATSNNNLPAGGSVTYTAICPISAGASGTLVNTATVATAGGVTDSVPGNNSATDSDALVPPPQVTVTPTSIAVNEAGPTSQSFVVALDQAPPSNVTIALTFDGNLQVDTGGGFGASPQTLTLTPANAVGGVSVAVRAVDDSIDEASPHSSVVVTSATSGSGIYNGLSVADVTASISDNDSAAVLLTQTSGLTLTAESGTTDTYTLILGSQPTASVNVAISFPASDLTVNGDSDGTYNTTFTISNWNSAQTITVAAVNDRALEGNHSGTLTHAFSSGDGNYNGVTALIDGATSSNSLAASISDNESAVVEWVPTSASAAEGASNGSAVRLDITADPVGGTPTLEGTLSYTISSGFTTAEAADIGAATGTLSFTNVSDLASNAISVAHLNDTLVEGAEAYSLSLSLAPLPPGMAVNISPTAFSGTITDGDSATVAISGGATVSEAVGTTPLTVTLTTAAGNTLENAVIVAVDLAAGSATFAADYFFNGPSPSASVTIPAGAATGASQSAAVTISEDALVENSETFSASQGTIIGAATAIGGSTTVTISDNEVASVSFQAATSSVGEAVTPHSVNAQLTITAVGAGTPLLAVPVSAAVTQTPGTATTPADYTLSTASVSFAVSTPSAATQPINIAIVDDAISDANESFSLGFGAVTGPGSASGSHTVTIADNDVPGVTITQSGTTDVTEGGASDNYTVVLTSQPIANVVIALSGAQVTPAPTPLTFTSGNWNLAQSVTVTAIDDAIAEGSHSGSVSSVATSSDGNYNNFAVAPVTVSITDNDSAGVTITQTGTTDVTEGGATDTYSAVLTSQPTADVTITPSTTGEVSISPASRTFTAANWNVPQNFTVTATDDAIVEGAENATITHTSASGDPNYQGASVASVSAAISDNDSATVQFAPTTFSQSEASSPMAFTVSLSAPVQSGVTLSVNSATGTATAPDFTAISGGTVSFAANSTTAQTVNVTINNDVLDEDDESYTLTLSGLTATGNVTLGAATATGTIVDDDPTPTLSVTSPSLDEGNSGTSVMNFTVSLSAISGRDVTFMRATADGTATVADNDYVALSAATLTIPAGQLSLGIPVTINGDTPYEGNESFSLAITGVSNATPASLSGTGTIIDDDQQPTTTTITSDTPDPTVVGQAYTVSASVVAQTTSPLGTVTISDGSASCNATLTAGTPPNSAMSCLLTSVSAGAKTLTASYTPASSAFAASSDTDTHQVNAAATTISVSGPVRSRINQATSFSFVLAVTTPGAGTPTGVVTLSSGAATCTATLPATSCNLTFTTLGARTVTASYASDGNFLSSTSSGAGNAQTLVYALSDLSISKTDGIGYYEPGDLLVYSVIVRNLGPDDAANIRVVDTIPAGLTDVVWSCDASGGGVCPAAGGAGNFDVTLANVRVGALLNFTFFGNVAGSPLVIANTAAIVLPADTTIEDPALGNNSATDTNQIDFTFRNGFEDPLVSAPAGSVRVAGIELARSLGNDAQVVLSLDDAQGEVLRVYARLHDNSLQYALAQRAGNGLLRLEAWSSLPGEPTLSWSARAVATGWVLESAQLR